MLYLATRVALINAKISLLDRLPDEKCSFNSRLFFCITMLRTGPEGSGGDSTSRTVISNPEVYILNPLIVMV